LSFWKKADVPILGGGEGGLQYVIVYKKEHVKHSCIENVIDDVPILGGGGGGLQYVIVVPERACKA
jgi:hypothetical protein